MRRPHRNDAFALVLNFFYICNLRREPRAGTSFDAKRCENFIIEIILLFFHAFYDMSGLATLVSLCPKSSSLRIRRRRARF